MQKSSTSSLRRMALENTKQQFDSKSDEANNKKFIDVGVQTELTFRDPLTSQYFIENAEPKVALFLPPNYSVVLLDKPTISVSREHSIINSVNQERIDFSINNCNDKAVSEFSKGNDNQDNEVSSTSDDSCKPPNIALPVVRRSSSFLEPPSRPTIDETEIGMHSKKVQQRHHSVYLPSSNPTKEQLQKMNMSFRKLKEKEMLKIVDFTMLRPVPKEQEPVRAFVDNNDQLLADILYALVCQAQNSRICLDELNQHLQTVFGISAERYREVMKVAKARKLPPFLVRLQQIAARKLKPRYSKGSADTYATLYLTSSPNDMQMTHVVFDNLNPVWETTMCFELNSHNTKAECMVVEIYDRIHDESVRGRMSKAMDMKGTSTLKRMKNAVQATVGNKTEDRWIGTTKVELKSYYEQTCWLELQKKDKPKKRGEIQVTYTKCAKMKQETALLEYEELTKLLVFHELADRKLKDFIFSGNFSETAHEILRLHAQNGGLTTTHVAFCHWFAAADVHLKHRLSFIWFQELLKVIEPELKHTKAEHVTNFWFASVKILSSMFSTIRLLRKTNFGNKSELESLTEVLNLMASLASLDPPKDIDLFPSELYRFLIKKDVTLTYDVLLKESIESGAKNYFEEITDDMDLVAVDNEANIQNFILVIQLLKADLQKSDEYYNRIFAKTMNVQCSRILYIIYDDLLYELMELPVRKACENMESIKYEDADLEQIGEKDDMNMKTSLFDLYLNISQFLKKGLQDWPEIEPMLKLKNFQFWFHHCVLYWLHMSITKAMVCILKAIELDNLIPMNDTFRQSTSAVDTMTIISQQKILWFQLDWPQPEEALLFLQRIFDHISNCCNLYAEKLFEKVQSMDRPGNAIVTQQWCTTTNNIQFVCNHLSSLVKEFTIDQAVGQKDDLKQGSENLKSIVENKIRILEEKNDEAFSQMAEELAAIIRGQLLELANDKQRESDAVEVLMLFLENSLEHLHNGLIEKNFLVLFEKFWRKISQTVEDIVMDGLEELQPCSFYKNILKALNCMLESFNSTNETQLCLANILKPTLFLLQKHGALTSELICAYYKERTKEQAKMTNAPLGILTISCHFKDLDLIINVMNAKHLPPMNSDGKTNDVYVKVALLPENMFPGMKKMKTKTKKKTLFPIFDESFVVPLSRAQRNDHDTIIHFQVSSREGFTMTTQNHHIGDGFLSIKQVDEWESGVALVKQHQLKLSRASKLDYDCINILERRQSVDKEAKDFLKDLKSKII